MCNISTRSITQASTLRAVQDSFYNHTGLQSMSHIILKKCVHKISRWGLLQGANNNKRMSLVIFLFVEVVHFGHFNLVVQLPVESQFAVIDIKFKKKPVILSSTCNAWAFYLILNLFNRLFYRWIYRAKILLDSISLGTGKFANIEINRFVKLGWKNYLTIYINFKKVQFRKKIKIKSALVTIYIKG